MKMFIECEISFRTIAPSLDCMGKLILLPALSDKSIADVSWKIWVLSTWVESIPHCLERKSLLHIPSRIIKGVDAIETDMVIIGAGSS
jgi:hypothetical protein